MPPIEQEFIAGLQKELGSHAIYASLATLEDLRVFMSHHVHSVWDFMSLIKYLQSHVAPARLPWSPGDDPDVVRFINELVLEEESDEAIAGSPRRFASHFELYLAAMREVGADAERPRRFVAIAARDGIEAALASGLAPEPSARFNRSTFALLADDRPHVVAAALALGREHVIPAMFRAFLERMSVSEADAPIFHHYLRRHVQLDQDFHAPLSLRLLEKLCGTDATRSREARTAARHAVDVRIRFWDDVLENLPSRRLLTRAG